MLEFTESAMFATIEETLLKMTRLKALGVCFSIDDFGTGYSSLSYLKNMPLDELKIDRSFVRDVLTNLRDAAIVRTIVGLGQSLHLSVIAEGVETEEQRLRTVNATEPSSLNHLQSLPFDGLKIDRSHRFDGHSRKGTALVLPKRS